MMKIKILNIQLRAGANVAHILFETEEKAKDVKR